MPNFTPRNHFGKPTPQENSATPADNPLSIDSNLMLLRTEALEKAGFSDTYCYITSAFIQATLPHSARAAETVQVTQNGRKTIVMTNPFQLPYGTYPRLILMYFTKMALRRAADFGLTETLKDTDPKKYDELLDQARTVPIAPTIAGFMREMGINTSAHSSRARVIFRRQLNLLLKTAVYEINDRDFKIESLDASDNNFIADSQRLWWSRSADGPTISDNHHSSVTFGRAFFEGMIFHAVPVDPAHIAYLKKSPLALDFYMWATFRLSYAKYPVRVTWEQIRGQFGVGYPETPRGDADFRRKSRTAIKKIQTIWPDAGIAEWENGLILSGDPAISPSRKKGGNDGVDPMF